MFRTEVSVPNSEIDISHRDRILMIGSCFSDNIGARLEDDKFNVLTNPFGTVFNPISIFKLLRYAVDRTPPEASGFVELNGFHNHLDFHSKFSSESAKHLEESLHTAITATHSFLESTDILILTLGAAVAYEHLDSGSTVANCHKIHQREFRKYNLGVDAILTSFEILSDTLEKFNPGLKIILTVSPVRHIKDTLVLNSLSKSILRTASQLLQEKHTNVEYFPSYEIMMDDLRDYRFYKADMIHPNEIAIQYIYEKFASTYFSSETKAIIKDWSSIRQSINHKPFNAQSRAHQQFISETIMKLERFSNKFDVSEEIQKLKNQLT